MLQHSNLSFKMKTINKYKAIVVNIIVFKYKNPNKNTITAV
jgi:hypothetical protein